MKDRNTFLLTSKEYEPYFEFWKGKKEAYGEGFIFKQESFNNSISTLQQKKVETFTLRKNYADNIFKIVGEDDAGVFLILFSLFGILLYKYTGEESIVVDTPLFGGNDGAMVSKVPLCYKMKSSESIREHLAKCQDVIKDHYHYQNFPLDLIGNSSQEISCRSNILIRYDGLHVTEPIEDNYDLIVNIKRQGSELNLELHYTGCFSDLFAANIQGHLQQSITYLRSLETRIAEVDILTIEENRKVAIGFNSRETSYPLEKTIHQMVEEQTSRTPNATALIYNDQVISYQHLNAQANKLAHHLRNTFLIRPNDIVGLMMERSESMIIAILGILKAGAAYLPLDVEYPVGRKEFILKDARVNLVITESTLMFQLGSYQSELFIMDIQLNALTESEKDPLPVNKPDDLAYVIYTSGSTGEPKGVLIEHRSNVNMSLDQIRKFKIDASDKVLQFASLSFDASVSEIFMALHSGAALVILDKEVIYDTERFLQFIQSKGVSVITFPPSYLSTLDLEKLRCLKVIITAGEAPKVKDAEVCSAFSNYFNAYGPTECAVCVSIEELTPSSPASNSISIGRPIANMEVYILNTDFQLCPVGIHGEIVVSGIGLAKGYLNRESLTKEKFIEHPVNGSKRIYRTGDVGKWLPDGRIEFVGRKDEQVKIRGNRIEVGEVESTLLKHSGIKGAFVMAREREDKSKFLVAYFISDEDLSTVEIKSHLEMHLPFYMVPSYFIPMKEFPLNVSGKVDRKVLPDPMKSVSQSQYLDPENDIEVTLVTLWQEVLVKEKIGTQDDFFDLGGDSIKAIRLVSLMNRELNILTEVKDVFTYSNVRKLAQYIIRDLDSSKREQEVISAAHEIESLRKQVLEDPNLSNLLPSDCADFYPLSDIQVGMLYYTLRQKTLGTYHDQMFHQFEDSSFDLIVFKKAIKLLVDKHPILRTSFHLASFTMPMQVVHSYSLSDRHVEYEDISLKSKLEQRSYLKGYLQEDLKTPFVFDNPGLWRIKIFRLAEAEYGLLFVCHHSIIDGWSDASFFAELSQIHHTLKTNPGFHPDSLSATYKDYIIDQLRFKQSPIIRDFWKKEMVDYQRTDLPFNKIPIETTLGLKNAVYTFMLKPELSASLFSYAGKKHVNSKSICLAAFVSLIKITTNSRNVTVGLTTNGRPEITDGDKILGCFLNTTPFRIDINNEMSGAALITAVNNKINQIKSFDKLPLQEILKIAGEKTTGQNPLFDLMFNYVDFHIQYEYPQQTQIKSPIVSGSGNSNTHFGISIEHIDPHFKVTIEYFKDLYTQEEIHRIEKYFNSIIEWLTSHAELPLSADTILSEDELQDLLKFSHGLQRPIPATPCLHVLFEDQVDRLPENIALIHDNRTLTYKEVNEKANQLAHYLQNTYSIRHDDLISVMMDRSEWMIIAILGILKSGAGYVPIDPDHPAERVEYILKHTGSKALIYDVDDSREFQNLVSFNPVTVAELTISLTKYPTHNPDVQPDPTKLAYVIYTSGSTGKAKGVMVEHRSSVNTLLDHIQRFSITERDRVMQFFSISFDASLVEIFTALLSGAVLVLPKKNIAKDIHQYLEFINSQNISVIALPPAFINLIPLEGLSSIRAILTGGDLSSMSTSIACSKFCDYFNVYGPTECAISVAAYKVSSADESKSRIPIGKPVDNMQVYILDDDLQLLPVGVEGEICISGVGVARGYLNDDSLTNQKFVSSKFSVHSKLYKTGDVGKWLPDGNIEFIGRIDRQVKIRGNRVEIGEIENTLSRYTDIEDVAVVVQEDATGDKYLVAYYLSRKKTQPGELKEFLSDYLPSYMHPSIFIPLESFPLSASGKVDYKALPSAETFRINTPYIEPVTEQEKMIQHIWQGILSKERIGIHDNFFEIGGDSIKIIKLHSELNKIFSSEVKIPQLFNNPTIASQSLLLISTTGARVKEVQPIEIDF